MATKTEIPFGPLTPEDRDRLSDSFYDASKTELHKIAIERGVKPGEASRRRFSERVAARHAELKGMATEIDYTPLPIAELPAEKLVPPSGTGAK